MFTFMLNHPLMKVGARVMTLVNRRESDNQFLYVNGDTGVVAEIDCDEEGHGFVTVDLDNGKRVEVGYYRWVASEYSAVEDVITDNTVMKRRVVGSFEQIPLKLAYAITIHKSQGMGFDQVNIFLGNGCFEKGQLYTALSRSRTLEGLSLDHCIREEDVMSDPAVVNFYKKLEEESPVDSKLYAEIMLTVTAVRGKSADKIPEKLRLIGVNSSQEASRVSSESMTGLQASTNSASAYRE